MSSLSGQLSIAVASVPDRDELVAELWSGDTQVAELSREQGRFVLELFRPPTGEGWALPYERFSQALQEMRRRLDG